VCTKAGSHPRPCRLVTAEDLVGGMHSMAPDFLADQDLTSAARNLDVDTIDVFYLHIPRRSSLSFISKN